MFCGVAACDDAQTGDWLHWKLDGRSVHEHTATGPTLCSDNGRTQYITKRMVSDAGPTPGCPRCNCGEVSHCDVYRKCMGETSLQKLGGAMNLQRARQARVQLPPTAWCHTHSCTARNWWMLLLACRVISPPLDGDCKRRRLRGKSSAAECYCQSLTVHQRNRHNND